MHKNRNFTKTIPQGKHYFVEIDFT